MRKTFVQSATAAVLVALASTLVACASGSETSTTTSTVTSADGAVTGASTQTFEQHQQLVFLLIYVHFSGRLSCDAG